MLYMSWFTQSSSMPQLQSIPANIITGKDKDKQINKTRLNAGGADTAYDRIWYIL